MKRTKPRLVTCAILTALLLAFIWGNSLLTGETSGQVSGWVGQVIGTIFPFLSPDTQLGHLVLRKLGHFSEFAALGLCLAWLFGMLMERRVLAVSLPLAGGILAAGIDETIQIFTPGRYSSIVDVTIDTCGALTGIGIMYLLYLVGKLIHRRKSKQSKCK